MPTRNAYDFHAYCPHGNGYGVLLPDVQEMKAAEFCRSCYAWLMVQRLEKRGFSVAGHIARCPCVCHNRTGEILEPTPRYERIREIHHRAPAPAEIAVSEDEVDAACRPYKPSELADYLDLLSQRILNDSYVEDGVLLWKLDAAAPARLEYAARGLRAALRKRAEKVGKQK